MTRPSLTSCSAPTFDYFWYETNPANGLIKDRSSDPSLSSIAAVGFGLSALTVGIDRGWINREAGRTRVLTTLEFLWNSPQGPERMLQATRVSITISSTCKPGGAMGIRSCPRLTPRCCWQECCTCSSTSISMTLQKPRSVPWPTTCIAASSGRGCKCARRESATAGHRRQVFSPMTGVATTKR